MYKTSWREHEKKILMALETELFNFLDNKKTRSINKINGISSKLKSFLLQTILAWKKILVKHILDKEFVSRIKNHYNSVTTQLKNGQKMRTFHQRYMKGKNMKRGSTSSIIREMQC